MYFKIFSVVIAILLRMFFVNDLAICNANIDDELVNILDGKKYSFSSDEDSLENFSCDILFPLEEKNVVFKIAYKKNEFFNISCFNEQGLEFLSITNNNISFISKGKLFCYLRKNTKVQFSCIVTEEDINFEPKFSFEDNGKGQQEKDGFAIDISKLVNYLLTNKKFIKTKKLSSVNNATEYQFSFVKKSENKTSNLTLTVDANSEPFSLLEITIMSKGHEQKRSFNISNVVYNSPAFSEVEKDESFVKKNKYNIEDIEIVNKELEGQGLGEFILSLLNELSLERDDFYYYNSGLIKLVQEKDKEAIADFQKAIEISKNDIRAYRCLSALFFRKGRF